MAFVAVLPMVMQRDSFAHAADLGSNGLYSVAPTGAYAKEMQPFNRLIGDWDVSVINGLPQKQKPLRGKWHFEWGLDSRAIIDVFSVPGYEDGITIRFYDQKIHAWRITYVGPRQGIVAEFIGKRLGSAIVLDATEANGDRDRWVFCCITDTTFEWKREGSTDRGRTWTVYQRINARRKINQGSTL